MIFDRVVEGVKTDGGIVEGKEYDEGLLQRNLFILLDVFKLIPLEIFRMEEIRNILLRPRRRHLSFLFNYVFIWDKNSIY